MSLRLPLSVVIAKRELRRGKMSFALSTATMALAVAMLGSVTGLADALRSTLDKDARALRGGDADVELESRSFTEDELAWFAGNSDRLTKSTYLRAAAFTEQHTVLVQMRAVDEAYPLFGSVVMSDGSEYDHAKFASGADAAELPALISEQLVEILGSVGDTFAVGAATLRIAGIISKVPDPSSTMIVSAPIVYVDLNALPATGLHLPGTLKDENVRVDLGERTYAEWKTQLGEAFSNAPWRVRGLDNTVPGLRRVLGRVEALLLLVSLGTLLVAGICVGNTITSYLRSRLTPIAMLKALGMPAAQLRACFSLVAMSFAFAGSLIGMPIAYIGQILIVDALSARLPFDVEAVLTWRQVIMVPAVALLTAWIFTIIPMHTFSAISPARLFSASAGHAPVGEKPSRQAYVAMLLPAIVVFGLLAIAAGDKLFLMWFVLGGAATCIVFRLLSEAMVRLAGKLHPRGIIMRIGLRSIARSGGSVGSAAAALGIGLSALLTLALTQANFDNELTARLETKVPAFYLAGMQGGDAQRIREASGSMLNENEGLRELPVQRARITHFAGVPIDEISVPEGFEWIVRGNRFITWAPDSDADWRGASRVSSGDHWSATNDELLVSFDEEAAEAFGLSIGDKVGLNILGEDYDVTIRNMRRIDWSTFDVNFVMVLSDGPWKDLPHGYLGSVRDVNGDQNQFQRLVVEVAPSVTPIRTREILESANSLLRKLGVLISAVTLTALVSGVLVLAAAISEGRHRRAHDAIVLRMLGSARSLLAGIFRVEFAAIALLAVIPALATAAIASYAITNAVLELGWRVDWPSALLIVAATLIIVQILGSASTSRLVRNPPLAMLRND